MKYRTSYVYNYVVDVNIIVYYYENYEIIFKWLNIKT